MNLWKATGTIGGLTMVSRILGFAREIIATSVRNGGFPPLMLDPIDFVALYQQRLAQEAPPATA